MAGLGLSLMWRPTRPREGGAFWTNSTKFCQTNWRVFRGSLICLSLLLRSRRINSLIFSPKDLSRRANKLTHLGRLVTELLVIESLRDSPLSYASLDQSGHFIQDMNRYCLSPMTNDALAAFA